MEIKLRGEKGFFMAKCSFCGNAIKPGTGLLFVKKEGTAFFFCSRKCEKNMIKLGRSGAKTRWTALFREAKKAGKKKAVQPEKEKGK